MDTHDATNSLSIHSFSNLQEFVQKVRQEIEKTTFDDVGWVLENKWAPQLMSELSNEEHAGLFQKLANGTDSDEKLLNRLQTALSLGANPNAQFSGMSPLMFALLHDWPAGISFWENKCDHAVVSPKGFTAAWLACQRKTLDIPLIKLFAKSHPVSTGKDLLMAMIIKSSSIEAVEAVIDQSNLYHTDPNDNAFIILCMKGADEEVLVKLAREMKNRDIDSGILMAEKLANRMIELSIESQNEGGGGFVKLFKGLDILYSFGLLKDDVKKRVVDRAEEIGAHMPMIFAEKEQVVLQDEIPSQKQGAKTDPLPSSKNDEIVSAKRTARRM